MPKTKGFMALFAVLLLACGGFLAWQQESDEPLITAAEGSALSSVFFVWEESETAAERAFSAEESGEAETQTAAPERWITATQPLLVNINTADAAELEKLPGIGPSKAEAILAFRTEHGPFAAVEDLMQVPGIKEATFAKLKSYVTV